MPTKNTALGGNALYEHQLLMSYLVTNFNVWIKYHKPMHKLIATPETQIEATPNGKIPDVLVWEWNTSPLTASFAVELCKKSKLAETKTKAIELFNQYPNLREVAVIEYVTRHITLYRKSSGEVKEVKNGVSIIFNKNLSHFAVGFLEFKVRPKR